MVARLEWRRLTLYAIAVTRVYVTTFALWLVLYVAAPPPLGCKLPDTYIIASLFAWLYAMSEAYVGSVLASKGVEELDHALAAAGLAMLLRAVATGGAYSLALAALGYPDCGLPLAVASIVTAAAVASCALLCRRGSG